MTQIWYWAMTSPWARKHFRCDYKGSCDKPPRRMLVSRGEVLPSVAYCYRHYLEAKWMTAPEPSAVPKEEP